MKLSLRSTSASLLIASTFLFGGGAIRGQERYVHEFHADFRGKPVPKELQIMGKAPEEFLKEEKEGFRITLPETWVHSFGGVGFRTTFGFKGDFQVTAAIDILQADVPKQGYGVGATLFVNQGEPRNRGASMARVARSGNRQLIFWDLVYNNKEAPNAGGIFNCKDNKLRLRLKRVGKALHYLWAPGLEGDNFEQIKLAPDFGDADITAARINAITGREPYKVDVRFLSFHIGSGGLQKDPNVAPLPPPPIDPDDKKAAEAGQGSWVKAILIIGALLFAVFVLAAAGAMLVLLKRRQPAVADTGALVNFFCTSCGKSLKAKAAASGKQIKCAKCGKSVLVPEA
jgi:DNA-directed RNA polymerase subunit RPC12/RpoP